MHTSRRKLALASLVALVVAFFAIRTAPARRLLAQSSMYMGAYNGMRRDLYRLAMTPDRWKSRSAIRDYVRDHEVRKLQIGAGAARMPGWLNTDIEVEGGLVYLDATEPFPIDDGAFHYVYSEHLIEHLSYDDGVKMLRETHRILAPGGKVRLATPNLLRFVELFEENKTDEMRAYIAGKLKWHDWPAYPTAECFILNGQMTWFGHRFLYDPGTLRAALARAGFRDIREWPVGESDDPNLRGVEMRAFSDLNNYEAMVFEAVKP